MKSYGWKRWNKRRETDQDIASGEAARRYYSAKEFLLHGALNFFFKTN
jgi:hypothetical protein